MVKYPASPLRSQSYLQNLKIKEVKKVKIKIGHIKIFYEECKE